MAMVKVKVKGKTIVFTEILYQK